MHSIFVIDSHTGGEPTRVVTSGFPDLGAGPLPERVVRLRQHYDRWRSATVCEPRGSDVLVGAVLVPPHAPNCEAGVIFFNNVGYLGMCGHGLIGVVTTLAWMGRLGTGWHRFDTPAGTVRAHLHDDGSVSIENVASWRFRMQVDVRLDDGSVVAGDIAYGGNWFFLTDQHGVPVERAHIPALQARAVQVASALEREGIRGVDGAPIDHIEFFGPSQQADSRNFVLCPGLAYDRSPCGTGTSAKLACLAADGLLPPGQPWRQESISGSVFVGSYQPGLEGRVLPSIRGQAWITAKGELLVDPADPIAWGL
jgi:4-hydroxyproline epimerase